MGGICLWQLVSLQLEVGVGGGEGKRTDLEDLGVDADVADQVVEAVLEFGEGSCCRFGGRLGWRWCPAVEDVLDAQQTRLKQLDGA